MRTYGYHEGPNTISKTPQAGRVGSSIDIIYFCTKYIISMAVVQEVKKRTTMTLHHSGRGIPVMMRVGWLLRTTVLNFGN